MKNFKKPKNKGFTLIELTISSSILAIIFAGIIIFGINTIRSYQRSQALKNTIEDARYAIEILNKTIRTSHKINDGGTEIFVLDNVDNQGHCYRFENDKLKRKIGPANSVSSCLDINDAAFIDIVGNNEIKVTGTFKLKETDLASDKRGFVRTNFKLSYATTDQDNFQDDEVIIQSSVSLRDYGLEL